MLKIPHPNKGGFIPSFLKRYQRYESVLKATIIDAYVNRISTGRMRSLVNSMEFRGQSKAIGVLPNISSCLNLFTLYAIKYADSWEGISTVEGGNHGDFLNKNIYTIA